MNFCSVCGAGVVLRSLEHDARARYVCTACTTVHYENPRVIVGCFVHWRERVLMCRRAQAPDAGRWMIPSGFLEHGETLQGAAAREVREECGLEVDPSRLTLYAVWSMPPIGQVGVSFRVTLSVEPRLLAGPECSDVAMLSEGEIPFSELAWATAAAPPMRAFFAQLRARRFAVHLRELAPDGSGEAGARALWLDADIAAHEGPGPG